MSNIEAEERADEIKHPKIQFAKSLKQWATKDYKNDTNESRFLF